MNPSTTVLIAFVVFLLGGLACFAWLTVTGHPWFAILVLVMISSVRMRWKSS